MPSRAGGGAARHQQAADAIDGNEILREEELADLERSISTVEEVIGYLQAQRLGPTDSVLYIMRCSVDVQRIATLQQLRNYCDTAANETSRLLRTLCVSIPQYEAPVQVAAAQGLRSILPQVAPLTVMAAFHSVQAVLFSVAEAAREEWQATYLAIVRLLPGDALVLYGIPFLQLLIGGEPSNSEQKVFACRLAAVMQGEGVDGGGGVITTHGNVFHSLLSAAAGDQEVAVRLAAAENLAAISAHVSCVEFRERSLPIVLQLLLDDDVRVASACFAQLVQLSARFDDKLFVQSFLLPIFLRFAHHAPPIAQDAAFREFGRLMWNTRAFLSSAELEQLLGVFAEMCGSPLEMLRTHAAFNLPAVAACAHSNSSCRARLVPLVEQLSRDSSSEVRIRTAAGFHELLRFLAVTAAATQTEQGPTAAVAAAAGECQVLQHTFLRLFADGDIRVRERVAAHLDLILDAFRDAVDPERRPAFVAHLFPLITSYEAAIAHNWRKLDLLVKHYALLPQWFSVSALHRDFVPILTQHLARGAAALNSRLADVIATFLSIFDTNEEKAAMLNVLSELVQVLSHGKSHAARIAYVDLCAGMLDHFSGAFFESFLLPGLLRLRDDPVPNVRLRLLRLLPRLRAMPLFRDRTESIFYARYKTAAAGAPGAPEAAERDLDVLRAFEEAQLVVVPFDAARDAERQQREGDMQSAEIAKMRLHLRQEAAREEKVRTVAAAAAAGAAKRKTGSAVGAGLAAASLRGTRRTSGPSPGAR